jgi:homospermidine synthase
MKNKIGLIVEGRTDKKFFDNYFRTQFGFTKNMLVLTSSTNNTCKIMNERAIKNKIQDLRDKNCNEILILIDLDSKCKKKIYDCVVELRNDYISKLKLSKETNVKIIVVSSEIEAWMLSAYKKSDKKKKEDLKKYFNIKSNSNIEVLLLQKFIKSQEDIKPKNNQSLEYFLKQLG